ARSRSRQLLPLPAAARRAPVVPDWASALRLKGKPSGRGASVRWRKMLSRGVFLFNRQGIETVAIGGIDQIVEAVDEAEALVEPHARRVFVIDRKPQINAAAFFRDR